MKYTKNRIIIPVYIIIQFLYNLMNILFAWIIMEITDSLSRKEHSLFINYLYIAIFTILLQVIFNILSSFLQNKIVNESIFNIKMMSFYNVLKDENTSFDSNFISSNIAYFTNEIERYENEYLRSILNIINGIILIIFSGIALLKIHTEILYIVIFLVIIMMIIPMISSKFLYNINAIYLDYNRLFIKKIEEFFRGIQVIKSFFIESEIIKKYKFYLKKCIESKKKLENKMMLFNGIIGGMNTLIILVIFIIGGRLVLIDKISIGALLASIQLVTNMIYPLSDILCNINEINIIKEIKNKVNYIINNTDCKFEKEYNISIGSTLKIFGLKFRYKNQSEEILNNINMIFERGKTYALVGENGCGKSTLAKIISGYYEDYQGEIMIGEKEIKEYPKNRIRSRIKYIDGKEFLFDDSPMNNCTLFGKYEMNLEMVHMMRADKLLEYKGTSERISEGEKQKIAFIRSFNKELDVLICDEAESSMDIIARNRFRELLIKDNKRIKIVVTHIINESLMDYDEIIFLERGEIREKGKFKELYLKKGKFYEFYENKKLENPY